jgi:PAS domain-containing protein
MAAHFGDIWNAPPHWTIPLRRMDTAEAPLDVDRLARPGEDAFRLIAAALGARFAGDAIGSSAPPSPREPAARDPRAEALLDRIPLPAVVTDGNTVAFLNRAAHAALGYRTAAALDAAGGLGALFHRTDTAPAEPGTLMIAAANGATFPARVAMSAVDWGDGRAMLVTLEPREPSPPRQRGAIGDLLIQFLDANPDPVALVSRAGVVEACNAAFASLAPGEGSGGLDGRFAPADLRAVLAAIGHAFCLAEGVAEPPAPVAVAEASYRVTVGPLPGNRLACLVLHPEAPSSARAAPATPAENRRGALERAVADVRRLVDEAAVLVIVDGAPPDEGDEPAVRFWRSLILSVAARAEIGSVLSILHQDGTTTLRLAPRATAPLDRALASLRIADLAAAAALEIGSAGDALVVRHTHTDVDVGRLDNLR